jgi:all-trans-retinol 13,14-reductase
MLLFRCKQFGRSNFSLTRIYHKKLIYSKFGIVNGKPASCFLSFPSSNNPGASAHTAMIVSPMDFDVVKKWGEQSWRARDIEYHNFKERVIEGLLDLVETIHPGFKNCVSFTELATPLTFEHFTGHPQGAIYGIPMTPERFHNKGLGIRTPIKNLYLTGADVCSPGIVGAMMGGVGTAAYLSGGFGLIKIIAAAQRSRSYR